MVQTPALTLRYAVVSGLILAAARRVAALFIGCCPSERPVPGKRTRRGVQRRYVASTVRAADSYREARAPFDMELEVSGDVAEALCRFLDALKIIPVGECVYQRNPVPVLQAPRLVLIERKPQHAEEPKNYGQTGALLVRPIHKPNSCRRVTWIRR